MANETIGIIRCPFDTNCTGEVRRYKTGKRKLYWVCEHGMITPNLPAGQRWIEQRANFHDAEAPQAGTETQPQTAQPKPARKSWLDALFSEDEE